MSDLRHNGKPVSPHALAGMLIAQDVAAESRLRSYAFQRLKEIVREVKTELAQIPETPEESEIRTRMRLPSVEEFADDLCVVYDNGSAKIRFRTFEGLAARITELGTYSGIPSRPYMSKLAESVKRLRRECQERLNKKE